jgi:hypothetical protein
MILQSTKSGILAGVSTNFNVASASALVGCTGL